MGFHEPSGDKATASYRNIKMSHLRVLLIADIMRSRNLSRELTPGPGG